METLTEQNDTNDLEQPTSKWRGTLGLWALCLGCALVLAYAVQQSSAYPVREDDRASGLAPASVVSVGLPPGDVSTASTSTTGTPIRAATSSTPTRTLVPTRTTTGTPSIAPTNTPRPAAYSSPSRIRIPKINVDSDVTEVGYVVSEENGETVTVWDVADFAAGFHRGSAYPGRPGNTVIAGHNNIRGRVFRHLLDLRPGDDIFLYVGEQEFPYVVSERLLIKEKGVAVEIQRENAKWIQPTSDERLTLVSCWPFIRPDHRVVIVAHPPAG